MNPIGIDCQGLFADISPSRMFVETQESCDEWGMHIIFILAEFVLLGAPKVISGFPDTVQQTMFWIGIAGLVLYPGWQIYRKRKSVEPWHLMAVGLAGLIIFAAISLAGVWWQRNYIPISSATEITTNPTEVAHKASVTLLIRPSQDPQEIANHNMYRWFVFKSVGVNKDMKPMGIVAYYFFLIFDKPINTAYRRVTSLSNPNLTFNIIDISNRSAVVEISNTDLSGQTVEILFSDAPI